MIVANKNNHGVEYVILTSQTRYTMHTNAINGAHTVTHVRGRSPVASAFYVICGNTPGHQQTYSV